MRLSTRLTRSHLVIIGLVLIGAALSSPASSAPEPRFENFLVVGIAPDYETKRETNIGLLIDETAETVVKRLDRKKLIAN